jgi:sulfate/thiosulfate transport system permease protein
VAKWLLRIGALGYLALLLIVPLILIGYRTFQHGVSPVWNAMNSSDFSHALYLSVLVAAIVVPINVVFGIGTAWLIARRRMPMRWLVNGIIDLPFAMSPVVIGLAVFILYSSTSTLGTFFRGQGVQILFSLPGIVLVTLFVSLPFVVREAVPVLEEMGTDQEQAAAVLGARPYQSFFRVTLPIIRWSIVYGVVLTAARALGEYGAVNIVSGNIVGQTQTLPLYVEQANRLNDDPGAYSAGLLLAVISLIILVGMTLLTSRRRHQEDT